MPSINPTPEQLKEFKNMPDDGPIVMVNLLKFKPGGAEIYKKYMHGTAGPFMAVGASIVFQGAWQMALIGEGDWDEVLLAQYPSITAFMEMQKNPDYQATLHYREEALADSRLWAVKA